MLQFQTLEGTPGLRLDEIAHVIVPGRGRSNNGLDIAPKGLERIAQAAIFFHAYNLLDASGTVISTGYKSPADREGDPWETPEQPGVVYKGVPEADLGRSALLNLGVPARAIRVERNSIDTVTNFTRSEAEGKFDDDRPAIIVTQREHLERILADIAPKTMRREYMGLVVPEPPDDREGDAYIARLFSRAVLLGIHPESRNIVACTERRAKVLWGGMLVARSVAQRLQPA